MNNEKWSWRYITCIEFSSMVMGYIMFEWEYKYWNLVKCPSQLTKIFNEVDLINLQFQANNDEWEFLTILSNFEFITKLKRQILYVKSLKCF